MRDILDLRAFREDNRARPLALCTLIHKTNSGYRAVGAKKIVACDGSGDDGSCGLLSGGCLEGDIERTARENWDTMPFVRDFSTMSETTVCWAIRPDAPGSSIFCSKPCPAMPISIYTFHSVTNERRTACMCRWDQTSRGARSFGGRTDAADIFFDPWIDTVTLTIIGCGADAPAFAELAAPLRWRLRFFDYRSHHVLPSRLMPYRAEIFDVAHIGAHVPTGPHSAVMLMTHNYEADMTILSQLAGRDFGYVGCLGPLVRYERLKSDLARLHGRIVPEAWEGVVHAPAGLFNGRSPEDIALSVIAQIQTVLRSA